MLQALDNMDAADGTAEEKTPFVDELDLFVTATDLEGVVVPLRLFDKVVYEKRHRHVFRFRYSQGGAQGRFVDDFDVDFNPFLAFAGRCTSSFPFAFEPMQLSDIDAVLRLPQFRRYGGIDRNQWVKFFDENAIGFDEPGENLGNYVSRPYGDGGYLDNRPFSFATETIATRQALVPVDRKLIYIEPAPEETKASSKSSSRARSDVQLEKPDAITNAKLALFSLPRYEPIREDLQNLQQRNRLIYRVNRITSDIEKDIDIFTTQGGEKNPGSRFSAHEWRTKDLPEMIQDYGIYYLPYRRLRIASLTDDIARIIARNRNLDIQSDYFMAVRSLIKAWRDHRYYQIKSASGLSVDQQGSIKNEERADKDRNGKASENRESINAFLDDLDLNYRLRRLIFLSRRVDQLTEVARTRLDAYGSDDPICYIGEEHQKLIDFLSAKDRKEQRVDFAALEIGDIKFLIEELVSFKQELLGYLNRLLAGRAILSSKAYPLGVQEYDAYAEIILFKKALESISLAELPLDNLLGMNEQPESEAVSASCHKIEEAECVRRAKDLLISNQQLREKLDNVGKRMIEAVKAIIGGTSETIRRYLEEHFYPESVAGVKDYLSSSFQQFDEYDQIRFPIFYDTLAAESDVIEIIRISPLDAISLIDENKQEPDQTGERRRKLAGTALHHFGAFLDKDWRQNDMMWGRLDGAERLITALLPENQYAEVRKALINEANEIILKEEIPEKCRQELGNKMAEVLHCEAEGLNLKKEIEEVIGKRTSVKFKKRLEDLVLGVLQDGRELIEFVKQFYRVDRKLEPRILLFEIARSVHVTGEVLDDIASRKQVGSAVTKWIARLGAVFVGLVKVSIPDSLLHHITKHFIAMFYLFWVVLVIASMFLGSDSTQQFALTVLGLTALTHVATLVIRDHMENKGGLRRLWIYVLGFFGLALTGLGIYQFIQILRSFSNWFLALWY